MVTAEQSPHDNCHETDDGTSASDVRDMSESNDSDATGWIVVGAASAVLFVGVGYTNTFGVFVRRANPYLQYHNDG